MNRATWTPVFASGLTLVIATAAAAGEKRYDPGVTEDQIKIGQTMPYSGAVSALGAVGKASAAYFAMINDEGGVNGRKIKLISLDDGYSPSKTVEQTRKPAGLEKSVGLISGRFYKDPTDPQWKNDAAYQAWLAWMKKYQPHGDIADGSNVAGYYTAQMLVEVLRRCGDELTRENVMRQATNLDIELPMLLPGIRVKTSPIDYYPIKQLQLARFDGTTWRLFGDILSDAPNSSQ